MYRESAGFSWVIATDDAGNEKADHLAGKAVEEPKWSPVTSMAYLKLQISEKFGEAKERLGTSRLRRDPPLRNLA